ncbi:phosphatidylcholine:ceramide cholinephosphotransferase 1-like isoform X2 [Acanthaster planci]|uniref:Phosphatidylcholine:ceramide cholinephosphotransferase 1-like isoform X2 n=1 Tax=Acanthaster planci TaxID=133434 RepID=A0A8B7Y2Z7_ACAPL|nr:phosphatidylcholine:ceramide cholinephosphotransferase 1-like isoform X2 [Acanthaster planci]
MEKSCCHTHTPNYLASRNGDARSSSDETSEMIGNDSTTVIDLDDPHEHQKSHGNGFMRNGGLSNGMHPSLAHAHGHQANGALPNSAIEKIAIEIAEAQASAAAHHAPSSPPRFESEPFKTVLAVLYCMLVSFMSAFTMTYTHDRTPDLTVSPPLPDVVFDLVPRIEWAFLACEIGMILLVVANLVNLTFHKHRHSEQMPLVPLSGLGHSRRFAFLHRGCPRALHGGRLDWHDRHQPHIPLLSHAGQHPGPPPPRPLQGPGVAALLPLPGGQNRRRGPQRVRVAVPMSLLLLAGGAQTLAPGQVRSRRLIPRSTNRSSVKLAQSL